MTVRDLTSLLRSREKYAARWWVLARAYSRPPNYTRNNLDRRPLATLSRGRPLARLYRLPKFYGLGERLTFGIKGVRRRAYSSSGRAEAIFRRGTNYELVNMRARDEAGLARSGYTLPTTRLFFFRRNPAKANLSGSYTTACKIEHSTGSCPEYQWDAGLCGSDAVSGFMGIEQQQRQRNPRLDRGTVCYKHNDAIDIHSHKPGWRIDKIRRIAPRRSEPGRPVLYKSEAAAGNFRPSPPSDALPVGGNERWTARIVIESSTCIVSGGPSLHELCPC